MAAFPDCGPSTLPIWLDLRGSERAEAAVHPGAYAMNEINVAREQ